jgi:myo-inositol 2-dehydrogenase/D-chiro-inositol 1-dehydrogenase
MSFAICTVGCGRMASGMHGPSLAMYRKSHPDVRLAACCDVDGEKARRLKDAFGYAASYTDLDAMLDTERPDAVNLVVQPAATAAAAMRIIDKGYPLIMEKPPGLTAEETRGIIAAARRSGVATRVAFNRRYMPVSVRLVELLRQEPRFAVEHIHYDFYRVGRTDADFSTSAIHAVDMVRFLAGDDYASVSFTYRSRPRPAVGDIFLDCRFRSGCTAQLAFCPEAGIEMERLVLNARDVTFFVDLPGWEPIDPPGAIVQFVKGERTRLVAEADLGGSKELCERIGFYGENATFFDELRAGRRPAGGVEESLQAVEIADCIRREQAVYGERE